MPTHSPTHLTLFPVAGVDEVGRGPLAGPVVAAAVVLDPARPVDGLDDSKALDAADRERLDALIRRKAVAWCVAEASIEEIDRLNILHASLLAMQRAVAGLACVPALVLVDGNRCPALETPSTAIVKGDSRVRCIAAASIIAKVARDRFMTEQDAVFPGFDFARHKGYGTAHHREALARLGATPLHRRSFTPVREALASRGPYRMRTAVVGLSPAEPATDGSVDGSVGALNGTLNEALNGAPPDAAMDASSGASAGCEPDRVVHS